MYFARNVFRTSESSRSCDAFHPRRGSKTAVLDERSVRRDARMLRHRGEGRRDAAAKTGDGLPRSVDPPDGGCDAEIRLLRVQGVLGDQAVRLEVRDICIT